jgi:hypothetical protein
MRLTVLVASQGKQDVFLHCIYIADRQSPQLLQSSHISFGQASLLDIGIIGTSTAIRNTSRTGLLQDVLSALNGQDTAAAH